MMKHILLVASTFALISAATFAQSADDRAGFAARGSQNKESQALAKQNGQQATAVGELYPNPTSDQASLQLNLGAPGKVTFYNLLGSPVSSQEFGKDVKSANFDFSNFADGVYFCIITSGNKTIATRRISVKH